MRAEAIRVEPGWAPPLAALRACVSAPGTGAAAGDALIKALGRAVRSTRP